VQEKKREAAEELKLREEAVQLQKKRAAEQKEMNEILEKLARFKNEPNVLCLSILHS
jgi:hypothetical protein